MGELIIVRNGHALRDADGPYGESEPLSDEGQRQARATGIFLKQLVGRRPVTEFVRAPGRRSQLTALGVAGAAGWSIPVQMEPRLTHRDKKLAEIERATGEWLTEKTNQTGIYVAVMSRRALMIVLRQALDLRPEDIECKPDYATETIPPGSVILSTFHGVELTVDTIFEGFDSSRYPIDQKRDT